MVQEYGGFSMKKRSFLTLLITVVVTVFFISSVPVLAKTSTTSSEKKTKQTVSKKTKKFKKSKKSKKSKSTKSKSKASLKTGKVNINTADAKSLTEFTGIGPKIAKNIIAYRKKNGKFRKAEDLLQVKGIGEKTLKKMRTQLKF
jgi:competence protein ComEA